MTKHSYTGDDITVGYTSTEDGRYRGRVCVKGHKLQPPSKGDYIVLSEESFDNKIAAEKWGINHVEENFPREQN